jgi:hypothetical protein
MMNHAKRLLTIAVLSAAAVTAAHAQTDERSIYVTALDKAGKPAASLGPGDFLVREGGLTREVLRVEPATEPAQIALLVDTSSAIDPYVGDMRRGLQAFFKEVAGKHEVALIGYGERPTVYVDYTRDVKRLEGGLGMVYQRANSGTELLEAIVDASKGLQRRKAVRPVIVIFYARGQEFGELNHVTVLDELRGYPVTMHALALTSRGAIPAGRPEQELEMTLAEGTKITGGRRQELLTTMALGDQLHAVLDEINNQYKVTYARPRTLIPPETLEVTARRPELTMRARQVP